MMSYWPWWAGALALGTITFLYDLVVGRRFGVSAAWDRVLHWRQERTAELVDEAALADADAFEAMLIAATNAEFGAIDRSGPDPVPTGRDLSLTSATVAAIAPASDHAEPSSDITPDRPRRPLPLVANLIFLVSVLVGALLASLAKGGFVARADMGEAFAATVVDGPLMWPTLFAGGLLVGIGTRLAGGCSSGHGLSGCSRLQPVSLLATAVFFGTAVAVSSLLYWVI